jgi:leucyl aminopeptidase
MNYQTSKENILNGTSDCLCLPVFTDGKLCPIGGKLDEQLDNSISKLIGNFKISGDSGKATLLPLDAKQYQRVLILGLGDTETLSKASFRKAAKALANSVKDSNIQKIALDFSSITLNDSKDSASETAAEIVLAIEESKYAFDQFKSKKATGSLLEEITFHIGNNENAIKASIKKAQALSAGMSFTKDLGNMPGNICTPIYLADQSEELAKNCEKLSVKVLDEEELEKLGMGAFVSVAKGSIESGKLVVLEYKGADDANEAPHMLVGKGITFDTGGISLKPGQLMDEMKYDMCGAASVLGTLKAIIQLDVKINLVCLLACAENMPSAYASKPGDIVTTMSGITVEIMNTDAEGRLVLCDTLSYAEQFKPASVVDIATLTGACIVALGYAASAVMGNNDDVINELLEAGLEAGDKAWQLPLWDEYQEQIDSPFADIQNIGGKGAGSITAACFLSRFTKSYPWAHLDIAGTAWVSGGKNKGATGRPVPLLLNYLLSKAAK